MCLCVCMQSVSVQVQFSPKLSEASVRAEAMALAVRRAAEEEKEKEKEKEKVKAEGEAAHSPDTKKKGGKRRRSLVHQASPLVSSIASLAASGTPTPSSSTMGHAESRTSKASLPNPEEG